MTVVSRAGVSDQYRELIQTSHQMALLIQVLHGATGDVLREISTVETGTVTLDGKAAVRGRCELEIIDDGTLDLVPTTAADDLAPFGNELRICRGVKYADGTDETVSLGIFRVRRVEPTESADGLMIRLVGLDRWSRFVDARFEAPFQIDAGTNFVTAILETAQAAWPDVPHDLGTTTLTTPTLVAAEGEDRGAFLQSMATAMGQELYFNGEGTLVKRPIAEASGIPGWTLAEGADGLLITAGRAWDAEQVYNRVIASGEPLDDGAAVRGVATDDSPTSPTYYYGPFGQRPRFYVSQMITTAAQAADAAAGILAGALGTSQQVDFGTIVDPTMEPGSTVQISREKLGLDEIHVVDELAVPLSATEPMTGKTRIAEVLGT